MKKLTLATLLLLILSIPQIVAAEGPEKIFRVSDYPTINDAVNAAETSGGVVFLDKGTYTRSENEGPIILKSGVSLIGQGSGTILLNDGAESNHHMVVVQGSKGTPITVSADVKHGAGAVGIPYPVKAFTSSFSVGQDVELADSKAKQFNGVVKVEDGTVYLRNRPSYPCKVSDSCTLTPVNLVHDVDIQNIIFQNNKAGGSAVYIDHARDIRVSGNSINSNSYGVYLNNSERVKVTDNHIYGGVHGISVQIDARTSVISSNTIDAAWTGIALSGHKNTIQGNTITRPGSGRTSGDGITVGDSASDNQVSGNIIDSGECYGIWIIGGGVKNNTFNGNTIRSGITTAISVNKGEGSVVTNNILTGNGHGVLVSGAKNTIVSGNNICDNYGIGIFVLYDNTSNTVITNNIIQGNGKGAIDLSDSLRNYVSGNIISGLFDKGSDKNNIIKENILN